MNYIAIACMLIVILQVVLVGYVLFRVWNKRYTIIIKPEKDKSLTWFLLQ